MSNSPLISFTKISPNKTRPRNHAIDTITIHCVVGQASVESLGNLFANKLREASCNYGIGADGRVGMYVEEKDRSWCSSSAANDHRAITIEVASDSFHPYKINDIAYESLINLLEDICKRNNIKELKWQGNKALIGQVDKQNMTVHRWFANKPCPGDYLYNLHGQIANEVNELLKPKFTVQTTTLIPGSYLIVSKLNGKVISQNNDTISVTNNQLIGDKSQIWEWNGTNFTNRGSGNRLDVSGGDLIPGKPAIIWKAHDGLNQQFNIGVNGEIIARHSNMALDIKDANQNNRAEIVQWPPHGGINQQWYFIEIK